MAQTPGPTAPTTLFDKIEAFGHEWLSDLEHGAAKLIGWLATSETSLKTLVASSPLVQMALAEGVKSAAAYGIPVTVVENAGQALLDLANQFATSLAAPPPVAAPEPLPAAA